MNAPLDPSVASGASLGQSLERVEDAALLTGSALFGDDMAVRGNTLYAAFLRSPHAHAEILGIDVSKALARPGVAAVITGPEVRAQTEPFIVGVKAPIEDWALAVDRVRYVGEPVAMVIASDRYKAEDALDAIEVHYRPIEPVVSPEQAMREDAPLLHPACKTNVVHDRSFRYGDPEAAFAQAGASRRHRGRVSARAVRADGRLRGASPTTAPPRTATTSWRTSRGRSRCSPSCRARCAWRRTSCACARRPTPAAASAPSWRSFRTSC